MKVINNHLKIERRLGMRPKKKPEAIYHGNNWCWSIDGHDKLTNFGIEVYGVIDCYSRRII